MSWITREFQFSKSQAEREFNCPLYKNYIRAAKTAKGTKWQRDPRKSLLSKFTLVENPCQRAFLFCNREKAKEFFEKDWTKRKSQKESSRRKSTSKRPSVYTKKSSSRVDLVSTKKMFKRSESVRGSQTARRSQTARSQTFRSQTFRSQTFRSQTVRASQGSQRDFTTSPDNASLSYLLQSGTIPKIPVFGSLTNVNALTPQEKTQKIGTFIRGFKSC